MILPMQAAVVLVQRGGFVSSRALANVISYFLLAVLFTLAGCAAPPKPPLSGLVPGLVVETLQSSVAFSVTSDGRSMGGRGFLVFARPDLFHLAILSPFGSVLADIYSEGERITCVVPGKKTAYRGLVSEVPDQSGLRAWALMRWVVERTPVAGPALVRENVNSSGVMELLYYDEQGLLARKVTEAGDRVAYGDYLSVAGVAVPGSIELGNPAGDTVRVIFEEPEVNRPVAETALTPDLSGLTVLTLAEFTGF